jgi:hypothetical protein
LEIRLPNESDDKKYEALCLENDELREVIRRQTAFVKADQIYANEIEFTSNRKKFENVKAAIEKSKDLSLVSSFSQFKENNNNKNCFI